MAAIDLTYCKARWPDGSDRLDAAMPATAVGRIRAALPSFSSQMHYWQSKGYNFAPTPPDQNGAAGYEWVFDIYVAGRWVHVHQKIKPAPKRR